MTNNSTTGKANNNLSPLDQIISNQNDLMAKNNRIERRQEKLLKKLSTIQILLVNLVIIVLVATSFLAVVVFGM